MVRPGRPFLPMPPPGLRAARAIAAVALAAGSVAHAQDARRWKAHDPERARPAVVAPASVVGQPPGDAIVLFDGSNLEAWAAQDGSPARWAVRDGYMETVAGGGAIRTRRGFGDVQLHLEFATPSRVEGSGQGRGNSGVILMGLYEVQVLDSYGNQTYADGQAAAVYGQYPPLVNASRGPGEWQSYDIVFRRPRFAPGGAVRSPARMTVFHNGVLVQDNVELWGGTDWLQYRPYTAHPDTLPLVLQDHANPVRYRNVWVRRLDDPGRSPGLATSRPLLNVPAAVLRAYAGTYASGDREVGEFGLRAGRLVLLMPGAPHRQLVLVPVTRTRFTLQHTAGTVEFSPVAGGKWQVRMQFAETDQTGVQR